MSLTVGKYSFGAWLRRGIGRSINEVDTLGAAPGSVPERATVPIDVLVNAQAVHKDFALLGPGDIIGIVPDAVLRTEPRNWVTEVEPNYLAFVEFYDEDFPWRFTPARPSGERLRPWLALLVLKAETPEQAGEFTIDERTLPLPALKVKSTAALPPHRQTWAWAHVHTNDTFDDPSDFERFLLSLQVPDHPNTDRIISRLASPRRLEPNTAYGAFLVPAFETGRLAGLGGSPAAVDAQQPSWTDAPGAIDFPIYHQWRFRTGENEDFESLVKRLEPQAADRRVGIRDMDAEKSGWGTVEPGDIGPILPADEKQSVLGLEGALKAPTTRSRPEAVEPSRPFFAELQNVLNFADDLRATPDLSALPVVSPPLYGEHHALRHRLDVTGSGWLDTLNRDPRSRVPAGFGTTVVQKDQEKYVARAWAQVQKVLQANRLIRLAAFAMRASEAVYTKFEARLSAAETVGFLAPVLGKVRGSPTTLRQLAEESTLPLSALSGAMRRITRPRGPIGRRLVESDPTFSLATLIEGMAKGRLTAAPPKGVAEALPTDSKSAAELPGARLPPWLEWLFANRALLLLLLIILILGALVIGAWAAPAVIAIVALGAWFLLDARWRKAKQAAALTDPEAIGGSLESARPRPAFEFVETDPVGSPPPGPDTVTTTSRIASSSGPEAVRFVQQVRRTPAGSAEDTFEAADFRQAAGALNARLSLASRVEPKPRQPFDLGHALARLRAALDPLKAFPRRVTAGVHFAFDPSWLLEPEHLVSAMAYPDFDDPMYEKLRDISSELLLPNLDLIPPNSVTLLKTNPAFIEAYLVGLNYEFGRELLWREYPTDRRGSYFRQFWDVRGILDPPDGASAADQSELGKDITPLDTWPAQSVLGSHRNPKRPAGEQLVLTIRGDLLKKYDNILVYAQKAHIARGPDGKVRPYEEPKLAPVESEADMRAEIKFPTFRAKVDPDIRFYGFDLSVAEARGADKPQAETDDWGYYFVIQQLPGAPRFGMDIGFEPDDSAATPLTWDDIGWGLFPDDMAFVDTERRPDSPPFTPAGPGENLSQWGSDSARMAAILFQKPVMIAVHAKEMLEASA
jgi:hypothetical protein